MKIYIRVILESYALVMIKYILLLQEMMDRYGSIKFQKNKIIIRYKILIKIKKNKKLVEFVF